MADATLSQDNVSEKIKTYLSELQTTKLPDFPSNLLELFRVLKRETIKSGPCKVS